MSNLAHDTTNDTRYADFMSTVRELGRDEATGKDSLPNLAIAFARAVSDGVIDLSKDAQGRDGAARVFEAYATAKGKKAVHDRTENGLKANTSKLRKIGEAAQLGSKGVDFVDVLNTGHVKRQECMDNDIDVKPAYAAFVDLAREQLKQDEQLNEDQIFAVVTKTASEKEVTAEGKLKEAQKIIDALITGEKWPGVQDNSPEVMQIGELLNTRIAALMVAAEAEKDEKALAEIAARKAAREQQIAA